MEMSKGVSLLRTAQSLLTGRTISDMKSLDKTSNNHGSKLIDICKYTNLFMEDLTKIRIWAILLLETHL